VQQSNVKGPSCLTPDGPMVMDVFWSSIIDQVNRLQARSDLLTQAEDDLRQLRYGDPP
jgi:hypothetical protein